MIFKIANTEDDFYNNILQWGKIKGIELSEKIEMNFRSVNDKFYTAKDKIEQGEILLKVPQKLMFTYDKAYNLSTSKFKGIFDKIKDTYSEVPLKSQDRFPEMRAEEMILSLAQLVANRKEKGKIYKLFNPFFSTFENNLDNYPVFYSEDQLNLLLNTSLGGQIELAKYTLDEEISFLNKFINNTIIPDDYYKYRILTVSKGFKIKDHLALVPFSDFFIQNPSNYSCENDYNDTENMFIIKSTKEIQKHEIIQLKTQLIPNPTNLLFFGKTYEGVDIFASYSLPVIHPRWLSEKNISTDEFELASNRMELTNPGFIKDATPFYDKVLAYMKMEQSEENVIKLIMENLLRYREDIDYVRGYDYYKIFYTKSDAKNIYRVVEMEKRILENGIDMVESVVKRRKEEEKKTWKEDWKWDPDADLNAKKDDDTTEINVDL